MAKVLSDAERIERYFTSAEPGEAKVMLEKATLILRVRGVVNPPAKRTRKPKAAQAQKDMPALAPEV